MREVKVSPSTERKIDELLLFWKQDLNMSAAARAKYRVRIFNFLNSLGNDADYALCRFEQWRRLGYHCVPFEKEWVFAYEIYPSGVIVRDMSNVAMLKK